MSMVEWWAGYVGEEDAFTERSTLLVIDDEDFDRCLSEPAMIALRRPPAAIPV